MLGRHPAVLQRTNSMIFCAPAATAAANVVPSLLTFAKSPPQQLRQIIEYGSHHYSLKLSQQCRCRQNARHHMTHPNLGLQSFSSHKFLPMRPRSLRTWQLQPWSQLGAITILNSVPWPLHAWASKPNFCGNIGCHSGNLGLFEGACLPWPSLKLELRKEKTFWCALCMGSTNNVSLMRASGWHLDPHAPKKAIAP